MAKTLLILFISLPINSVGNNCEDIFDVFKIAGYIICFEGFTGNGFWYMIWPTTVSISSIFFGSGTQKAPAPGGWHEHVLNWQEGDPITNSNHITVNQYSTTVKYHVYRSDNSFSGQMNIQF